MNQMSIATAPVATAKPAPVNLETMSTVERTIYGLMPYVANNHVVNVNGHTHAGRYFAGCVFSIDWLARRIEVVQDSDTDQNTVLSFGDIRQIHHGRLPNLR